MYDNRIRFIFRSIARKYLTKTKNIYDETGDEDARLSLRWAIDNMNTSQSMDIRNIWNDPSKVDQFVFSFF